MYALNVRKGTTIHHPEVTLKGGVAIPVSSHLANQLKHLVNVVIFDEVQGVNEEERVKQLYGVSINTLEEKETFKTYKDFMVEYKNQKIASQKWQEYKKRVELSE